MKLRKLLWLVITLISLNSLGQSISPSVNNDYCPSTNITFTVTLPGTGYTFPNVVGWAENVPAYVVPGSISGITTSGGNSSFTFVGSFADNNNTQAFRVTYTLNGQQGAVVFKYSKIRSFVTTVPESIPQPSPLSITAQRCQTQNFNISFSNVQFANTWESPKLVYGTETNYEYLLPIGWQLNGGTPSTGSDWKAGSNNVTITSDLSNGDSGYIQIRAVNGCAQNLVRGPSGYVSVSRPAPTLTITGTQDYICSGSTNFTINGMPFGSSVQWNVSNTTEASVSSGGTSPTVTISRIGSANTVVTLTATVTHCTFTYTVTHDIALGTPPPNPINVLLVDYQMGKIQVESEPPIPGATDYRWYKDGVLQTIYHWTFAQIPITRNRCDVGYGITVTQTNSCGTSAATYKGVYVPCDGYYYMVSPNPASSDITVSTDASKTQTTENKTFDEVRVYDLQGTLKKQQKLNKATTTTVNISGLSTGTYLIEIINGNYKERHQVLIQK